MAKISAIGGEVRREWRRKLFPTMKWMQEMYPALHTKPWLYPFCLVHRLVKKSVKILSGKGRMSNRKVAVEEQLTDDARERVELFKKMQIIEE